MTSCGGSSEREQVRGKSNIKTKKKVQEIVPEASSFEYPSVISTIRQNKLVIKGNEMVINEKFSIKSKLNETKNDIVYHLYYEDHYTAYYMNHSELEGLTKPMEHLVNTLLTKWKENNKKQRTAFEFD